MLRAPSSVSIFTHKPLCELCSHLSTRASAVCAMVKGIRIHEYGGPEVLKYEEIDVDEPGEGEVRVKISAIGLNFIDVYNRTGLYKSDKMPFIPGREAVGTVAAIGPNVKELKVGDRVGYAGNPMGAYCEEQILPESVLVPIPEGIDSVTAAAIMLKGMTAEGLLRRCFKVEPRHTILIHAAAGGMGSMLSQWGRALGATVIGCVSTKEKANQAAKDGCHHVIIYKDENFVERVKELTNGKGVHVVYDSVGKDTFLGSLDCLALRGYLVSFGQASGSPDPLPLSALSPKSLFLTRPSMMHYNATRGELLNSAKEVFDRVLSGELKVHVNQTYPLSNAAQAHADLENRKTTGSTVLLP